MDELVFAFPTAELWKLMPYKEKGLINGYSEALKKIIQNGLFLRRSELEEEPSAFGKLRVRTQRKNEELTQSDTEKHRVPQS